MACPTPAARAASPLNPPVLNSPELTSVLNPPAQIPELAAVPESPCAIPLLTGRLVLTTGLAR